MTRFAALLTILALALPACRGDQARTAGPACVAPPLKDVSNAFERAGRPALPERGAREWDDLHNVFRLSETIYTGGEPLDEAALERLANMGVRTVVSVDGKAPDHETARKHGLRYVHIPIRYSGITEDELARLAKTFRELEPPFYVHCFHGKHRGPAAAAVGRLVRDGAAREQALAEMRQYCGTSSSYEGLYRVIASEPMPSAQRTAALRFDFAPEHRFEGLRAVMIEMARVFDNLKLLAARDWQPDPAHPDLDPGNEAAKLHGLFVQAQGCDETERAAADFRGWLAGALSDSTDLEARLAAGETGNATRALRAVKKSCGACHAEYRND